MADPDTPEILFQRHQGYLARELSKGFTNDQVESWIVQLCDTLCKDKSISFMVRFAQLIRKAAHEVGIAKLDSVNKTGVSPDIHVIQGPISNFDPLVWKTVKIFRDDWKMVSKCIVRYEKQIGRKLRVEETD
jgi:hypothetical protein